MFKRGMRMSKKMLVFVAMIAVLAHGPVGCKMDGGLNEHGGGISCTPNQC